MLMISNWMRNERIYAREFEQVRKFLCIPNFFILFCIVLNFQAKFGPICSASAKFMLTLGHRLPGLLAQLKLDVSKLSIRIKPVQIPNRATHLIQCRTGYVTVNKSNEIVSNHAQHKENAQEVYNEKMLQQVNEIREEIDKTQLRFTQELHRLTINLSKLIDKWSFYLFSYYPRI